MDNCGPRFRSPKNQLGKDQLPVGSKGQEVKTEELERESEVTATVLEAPSEESEPENQSVAVENEGLGVVNQELGIGKDELEDHGLNGMDMPEEQMVAESIDGTTKYLDLVAKLYDLNRQAKLRKPLVGDLGATLYLYKANKDREDIEESFRATLLPQPVNETEGPTGFGISLEDLLGGHVPESQDRKDVVWFGFKRLEKFVSSSLPETEKFRASARAYKMLKEAGEWEEKETYAQGKRRRLKK